MTDWGGGMSAQVSLFADISTDWPALSAVSGVAMLNYAYEAGEACKVGNSYTATLWQHQQLICRQQLCQ